MLKAAWAEQMTAEELALFHEVAERDPPKRPVREFWVVAGRRAGKDSAASAIATTMSLADYRKFLRPGERASILTLGVDKLQGKIPLRYLKANFEQNPLLRPLIDGEARADGFDLTNGVEIIVATNNFRGIRGRSTPCVILTEIAFYPDEESARSDLELYHALAPA